MTTAELKIIIMSSVSSTCLENPNDIRELSEWWYKWVMEEIKVTEKEGNVTKLRPVS